MRPAPPPPRRQDSLPAPPPIPARDSLGAHAHEGYGAAYGRVPQHSGEEGPVEEVPGMELDRELEGQYHGKAR